MNNCLVDSDLFKKYLKDATIYGEYGAGDSTYFATLEPYLKEIHSVDSDRPWIEKTKRRLGDYPVTFYYRDINASHMNWGRPGPKATPEQKRAYSDPIPAAVDFVLIDGRFRVACALKLHQAITDSTVIAFDDFLDRGYYHVIKPYYTIIEQGKKMVILKRNPDVIPPADLIQTYELNMD